MLVILDGSNYGSARFLQRYECFGGVSFMITYRAGPISTDGTLILLALVTCGAREETTFHALVECTYARLFWAKLYEITGVKLPTLIPDT